MKKEEKKSISKADLIRRAIKELPFFEIENLLAIDENKNNLRILLSRMKRKGEILAIKRGMHVHFDYLTKVKIARNKKDYDEFIACLAYQPSYLSLEYVLAENGILSESVFNFTSATTAKTYKLANEFGNFHYYHLKDELFIGYGIIKKHGYLIYKAGAAKALFDFLYLRKNILLNRDTVKELRLNLGGFSKKDKSELKKYIKIEGSKRMLKIFNYLEF
ncbi:hypothetical protein KKC83_03420 [Patescibacteria group bacterium]|nr:hypothetical protein [Candidatus Falkowbacteria bacterium]MBU3906529.1 hypothetical protein [Patescibacteria group bacterium]MCG2697755.1 hypothetical protein [Candidatus Parcubacteria bacterium]MBU4015238.1 hypothetical protein [Patescibacteria group bacterium]MBU4026563.1 hypothetical protein [Patescibacteria group bacterium]